MGVEQQADPEKGLFHEHGHAKDLQKHSNGSTVEQTAAGDSTVVHDAKQQTWTLRSILCKVYRYALAQW